MVFKLYTLQTLRVSSITNQKRKGRFIETLHKIQTVKYLRHQPENFGYFNYKRMIIC